METKDLMPGSSAIAARPAKAFWKRSLWMRLGALNGLAAILMLLLADESAASLRQSAQIHFMHAMATLGCATFMNVGARQARHAPAFFLGGIVLYCFPAYFEAAGLASSFTAIRRCGIVAFIVGWSILALSARDIDKG
jgi:uncharacterized membrane protein YgdD (TMEM256/DUF423 family)